MKILFVAYFYEYHFGGAEIIARTIREIARDELGHQVDVVCFGGGPAVQPGEIFRVPRFPPFSEQAWKRTLLFLNNRFFDQRIRSEFERALSGRVYDVVHCHDFSALQVSYQLARRLGVPQLLSLYDNVPRSLNRGQAHPLLTSFLNRLLVRRAFSVSPAFSATRRIVCISRHIQQSARKFLEKTNRAGTPELVTIYPPAEKYFLSPPDQPAAPPKPGTVLFVGRLSAEKGLDLVLKALAEVKEPIELSILGIEGPLGSLAREAARRNPRIRLLEPRPHPEVRRVMEEHEVICCPSIYEEPFGKTVLEARVLRKKIVTTTRGGIAEIIAGYPNAFLVEFDELDQARTIRSLAGQMDAALRAKTIGGKAFERAEKTFLEPFTPATISRQLGALYADGGGQGKTLTR